MYGLLLDVFIQFLAAIQRLCCARHKKYEQFIIFWCTLFPLLYPEAQQKKYEATMDVSVSHLYNFVDRLTSSQEIRTEMVFAWP